MVLDEANLASLDVYAGRLVNAIRDGRALGFSGELKATGSAKWRPPAGTLVIATVNSYLEDPSRKQLSVPIKRRAQIINMPDRLSELIRLGDRSAFDAVCGHILQRAVDDASRRGTTVFDGKLTDQLGAGIPATVTDVLWDLAKELDSEPEVPFTLGLVRSIVEYVVVSSYPSLDTALDYGLAQKLVPALRGPVAIIDRVEPVVPTGFVRTLQALHDLRKASQSNFDRIKPLQ